MKFIMDFKKTEEMQKRVAAYDDKIRRTIYGTLLYYKMAMVKHAKENAPWRDRTGNARHGLFSPDIWWYGSGGRYEFNVYLAHSVHYGFRLETMHMGTGGYGYGKYSIIMPTILEYSPQIMDRIAKEIAMIRGAEGITWAYKSTDLMNTELSL